MDPALATVGFTDSDRTRRVHGTIGILSSSDAEETTIGITDDVGEFGVEKVDTDLSKKYLISELNNGSSAYASAKGTAPKSKQGQNGVIGDVYALTQLNTDPLGDTEEAELSRLRRVGKTPGKRRKGFYNGPLYEPHNDPHARKRQWSGKTKLGMPVGKLPFFPELDVMAGSASSENTWEPLAGDCFRDEVVSKVDPLTLYIESRVGSVRGLKQRPPANDEIQWNMCHCRSNGQNLDAGMVDLALAEASSGRLEVDQDVLDSMREKRSVGNALSGGRDHGFDREDNPAFMEDVPSNVKESETEVETAQMDLIRIGNVALEPTNTAMEE
jgi:hypothetical protein